MFGKILVGLVLCASATASLANDIQEIKSVTFTHAIEVNLPNDAEFVIVDSKQNSPFEQAAGLWDPSAPTAKQELLSIGSQWDIGSREVRHDIPQTFEVRHEFKMRSSKEMWMYNGEVSKFDTFTFKGRKMGYLRKWCRSRVSVKTHRLVKGSTTVWELVIGSSTHVPEKLQALEIYKGRSEFEDRFDHKKELGDNEHVTTITYISNIGKAEIKEITTTIEANANDPLHGRARLESSCPR